MPSAARLRATPDTRPAATPNLQLVSDLGHGPPPLVAVPPLTPVSRVLPDAIPDPDAAYVRALALQGYEAIEGTRTIAQLGPLITVGLARTLAQQRAARHDRRIVCRDDRRVVARAVSVRIVRIRADIAEAAVVLRLGERACAVALRIEWAHRHWRASELFVL